MKMFLRDIMYTVLNMCIDTCKSTWKQYCVIKFLCSLHGEEKKRVSLLGKQIKGFSLKEPSFITLLLYSIALSDTV